MTDVTGRSLWFRVGREYFSQLSDATAYRRKHGGEIEQVLATVLPAATRSERKVSPRRNRKPTTTRRSSRSKYDPTAALPDELTEFV